jgi:hypothetical protein
MVLVMMTLAICGCGGSEPEAEEHPITSAYRFECHTIFRDHDWTHGSIEVFRCRDFETLKCYLMSRTYKGGIHMEETDCVVLSGEYEYYMKKAIEERKVD